MEQQYELTSTPELLSLAAYVSKDGLVGHHWKERPIGLANFICPSTCLLYTSDAADDSLRVDLGGRRIIKKIFFKQKTAYEIASCLVGSEMCIRDRSLVRLCRGLANTEVDDHSQLLDGSHGPQWRS